MTNELNYPQWNDPEVAKMAPYIKTFGQSRPGFQLYSNAELLLLDQNLVATANDQIDEIVTEVVENEMIANEQVANQFEPVLNPDKQVPLMMPTSSYSLNRQGQHLLELLLIKNQQYWNYWIFKLAMVLLWLISLGGLIATVMLGFNGTLEQNVSWQIVVGLLSGVSGILLTMMIGTHLAIVKLMKTNNQTTLLNNYGFENAKPVLMVASIIPIAGLVASFIYGKRMQKLIKS